ncbi:MAG TPA: hypothetical protein VFP63_08845 [Dehalococcoidia bacterium]|nr:hypothetical protein [Dehalococcoidia bacterium]
MSDPLYAAIDSHFLAPEALARVRHLGRAARDADGWFKGELAYLVATLVDDGTLTDWRINVPIREGRPQRCDFRLLAARPEVSKDTPLWLEVKALPQGGSPSGRVDPGFFLQKGGPGDTSTALSAGITEDLVKLMRVPDGDTAVLLFAYPRPEADAWSEIMSAYARRIAPIAFKETTSLADYPPELYVCKLKLTGGF